MILAVSGKGGTGKTTLAALILRHLLHAGAKPILAVDADPNSNLADKLGLPAPTTIGDLREQVLKQKHDAPAGTPKHRAIEYEVERAVAEGTGFDLLVMGRGEGPGCYCSVNNMLRDFLQRLSSRYRHVVVDNEAGIEHLSRRTNDKVDVMLVVCDSTPTSLKSGRRVAVLMLQYLCAKHAVCDTREVSLGHFPDCRLYVGPFSKRVIGRFLRTVGRSGESFSAASAQLGGERLDGPGLSYRFQVLPRVPITLVLFEGDNEFGATANVLFQADAQHLLPAGTIIAAAELLVGALCGSGIEQKPRETDEKRH